MDGFDGEINTTYGNIDDYMTDIAKMFNYYLQNDLALKGKSWVRQERNPDAVFKKYIEPLLYRNYDGQV
jgi:hypothetical protein